jgi:hypothetical protein
MSVFNAMRLCPMADLCILGWVVPSHVSAPSIILTRQCASTSTSAPLPRLTTIVQYLHPRGTPRLVRSTPPRKTNTLIQCLVYPSVQEGDEVTVETCN